MTTAATAAAAIHVALRTNRRLSNAGATKNLNFEDRQAAELSGST
jgi:hypothetical protein